MTETTITYLILMLIWGNFGRSLGRRGGGWGGGAAGGAGGGRQGGGWDGGAAGGAEAAGGARDDTPARLIAGDVTTA
jgi:hypothetical protein